MKAPAGTKATAIATLLCLITIARGLAADLPAAPQPASVSYAPPSNYDWSGFYIGVNAGYGVGDTNWITPSTVVGPIGDFKIDGALAGGTLGINYQAGSAVFGFEADGDWTGFTGTSSNAYCSAIPPSVACQTKQLFQGTVRGRIGYAFNRVLLYGTGGFVVGNIMAGLVPPGMFDTATGFGWTAGGGLEVGITENWTVKVEYLYEDFGNGSCSINCGLNPFTGAGVPVIVPLTENVVRAGINYKFGF